MKAGKWRVRNRAQKKCTAFSLRTAPTGALLMFFFAFFRPCPGFALDWDPGNYGSITDYLNALYGIDENAALTAFPVLNIPMGGKAESMASSFASVCSDASFIEWNPAGASMLANDELAFFHNNWIADTKIEGIVYTRRFENLGVSAGTKWLYTPFTEYDAWGERVAKGYYVEGLGILNAAYNFFSSYHFYGFSVGASLKGAFRFVPDYSTATDVSTTDKAELIEGSGGEQSAAGLLADAGVLTRINFLKFYYSRERNFSLALVLRNAGPPALGDALPTVLTAGLSYKPVRPLLFSFDYSIPVNLDNLALSEKHYMAFGFSLNVTSFLSMSTGLLVKAGSIRYTIGSGINAGAVSFDVNYTLDLLTQLQPFNRVSVGIRFNMGDSGRSARLTRVEELYLDGLNSYSRGDDDTARGRWQEALNIDAKFTPAREGIEAIDGYRNLTDRVRDLQDTQQELFK
jgi:hypothetical protein